MENSSYETVAASQTDQALGASGQAGDYLDMLIITASTATTSNVSIKDGGGAAIPISPAATPIGVYSIRIAAHSRAGAWKVTTGAGATVLAVGSFT